MIKHVKANANFQVNEEDTFEFLCFTLTLFTICPKKTILEEQEINPSFFVKHIQHSLHCFAWLSQNDFYSGVLQTNSEEKKWLGNSNLCTETLKNLSCQINLKI